ncbi:MAG TPA: hypothetical protein VGK39_00665 [Cyclobacteriaceae bacterium]
MKRSIGSLFLFLYLVAMLRPVQPIIEYCFRYDYFAKVLCINKERPELKCNGKCILMQRLKKVSEESQPAPFMPAASNFSLKDYPLALLNVRTSEKSLQDHPLGNTLYNWDHRISWVAEIFHPPS